MLDVRRLRLLREVHVRGTLAAVSAALHLSPSAVSQQLAQLERDVGEPLLRKAGRRVQLTPQGEILVDHTAAILDRLEAAEAAVRASLGQATGVVRVAIFQSAAGALLVPTLALLAERHPRLRVSVTQREPETALFETYARDFDLVVAEQYPGHAAPWHPDLDRVELTHDAVRLAVPADRTDLADLAECAGEPWVVERGSAASRHFAEQACRRAGFEPDVRFETDDLHTHVELVRSGNAVAALPDLIWQSASRPSPDPREPRLLQLPGAPSRTVFTATRHSSAQHPSIDAVRSALADAASALTRHDR